MQVDDEELKEKNLELFEELEEVDGADGVYHDMEL